MSPHPFNSLPNGSNLKILWLIPLLLSFIFNLNVLENGYGWDDELIIPNLHTPRDPVQLFLPRLIEELPSQERAPYYRPFVSLSYEVDYLLWGETPSGFHLSVLIGHCINTLLVFFLVKLLLSGRPLFYGSGGIPLIAASIFAVHPIHAEAVAWIAGRSDVFCTVFILLSMIFYLNSLRSEKHGFYGLAMVSFFLALMTKESAIGLIVLFPVLDFLNAKSPRREISRAVVRFCVPLGVLLVYFWMRYVPAALNSAASPASSEFSVFSGLWDGVQVFVFYLRSLVFPFPVLPFIQELPNSMPYLFAAIPITFVLVGAALWFLYRRITLPGFGLAWTFCFLIPPLAVSVFGLAPTQAAERYLYTPSVGFLIAVSWIGVKGVGKLVSDDGGKALRRMKSVTSFGVVVLILFMGLESWERNRVWYSTETFWKQAALSAPDSGQPHRELGIDYQKRRMYAQSEFHVMRAIELDRKTYGARHTETGKDLNNLALLYEGQGRYREAVPLYQEVLAIGEGALGTDHPRLAFVLDSLAGVYRKEGQFELAEPLYLRAIKIREENYGPEHPSLADSLHGLARIYQQEGRYSKAEPFFIKAGEVRSEALGASHLITIKTYAGLAEVYRSQGKHAAAQEVYLRLLAVTETLFGPRNPYFASFQFGLAESYRMETRFLESLPLYENALKIQEENWGASSGNLLPTLESYMKALSKAGRKTEAAKVGERIGAIKGEGGNPLVS